MTTKIGDITLYSILDLSQKLEVTPLTLRKYITTGKLNGRKIGGRFFVSEESLRDFVNGRTDKQTSKAEK